MKFFLFYFVIILISVSSAELKSINSVSNSAISWDFGSYIKLPNDSIKFSLKFFSPQQPGSYQVIPFLPGLDGTVPGFAYNNFSEQLAIKANAIIVIFNKLSAVHLPVKEEVFYELTLNWTLTNIAALLQSNSAPSIIRGLVRPDLETNGVSLMSHSAGAHILCLYLVKNCGLVKSVVLLDPVDGYDPFGIVHDFVTNPPKKLPYQVPTLIVATGLSSVPANPIIVSCAPTNISNNRFYESLAGPVWYMNFTDYGHADILDDWIRECCSHLMCKMCEKDCKFADYRENLANAVAYFLEGVNNKNAKYIHVIENPMNSTYFDADMNIEAKFNYNGFNIIQTGPFCNHF